MARWRHSATGLWLCDLLQPPASQGPPAAAAAVAAAVAVEVVPAAADTSSVTSASLPTPLETLETKQLVFKDPNFVVCIFIYIAMNLFCTKSIQV